MLAPTLLRFEKLLCNKQSPLGSAALTTSGNTNPEPFANPMQSHVFWVPPNPHQPNHHQDLTHADAPKPSIRITTNDKLTFHDTWFKSKDSAQQFLDVLEAQVRSDTLPAAFAELVTAFLFLQSRQPKDNTITILDFDWLNDRTRLPAAISPTLLADCVEDYQSPTEIKIKDYTHFRKRPEWALPYEHVYWLTWHTPVDSNNITVALTKSRFDHSDSTPLIERLIQRRHTCSLIYLHTSVEYGRIWRSLQSPQKAHNGPVKWVEYMEYAADDGLQTARKEVTALARLFKRDADPVVMGLFLNTLKRFQLYPRDNDYGFQPATSSAHHWHAVWPIEYKDQIERHGNANETMEHFFEGLIMAAHPGYTVRGDIVPDSHLHYEFYLQPTQNGPTDAAWRCYECIADAHYIKIKITDTLMDIASDKETESDHFPSPPASEGHGSEDSEEYDSDDN